MTREEAARLDCARRAFCAHTRAMRTAAGKPPLTDAKLVANWEFAKAETIQAWLAVADAIGPRCGLRFEVPNDESEHSHYEACTLPAWHDREVEKCR